MIRHGLPWCSCVALRGACSARQGRAGGFRWALSDVIMKMA